MNVKRYVLAVVAVFIAFGIVDYLVHSLMLHETYAAMQGVWRADMMDKMWLMPVLNLVFTVMFVYIFTLNYEAKGLMEGVRYGLLMGLLIGPMGMFSQYAMYNVPLWLAWTWFGYVLVSMVVGGGVAAAVYRAPKRKRR